MKTRNLTFPILIIMLEIISALCTSVLSDNKCFKVMVIIVGGIICMVFTFIALNRIADEQEAKESIRDKAAEFNRLLAYANNTYYFPSNPNEDIFTNTARITLLTTYHSPLFSCRFVSFYVVV